MIISQRSKLLWGTMEMAYDFGRVTRVKHIGRMSKVDESSGFYMDFGLIKDEF
jgi:hypothetical protein